MQLTNLILTFPGTNDMRNMTGNQRTEKQQYRLPEPIRKAFLTGITVNMKDIPNSINVIDESGIKPAIALTAHLFYC